MLSTNTHNIEEPLFRLSGLNLKFQALNKSLENHKGLSVVQWTFLKTLSAMPAISPQGLAKALQITPGTLSQTMVRLERKNYIFVCGNPKDARKKMISLTRLGKEFLDRMDQEFTIVFAGIIDVFKELKSIEGVLSKISVREP